MRISNKCVEAQNYGYVEVMQEFVEIFESFDLATLELDKAEIERARQAYVDVRKAVETWHETSGVSPSIIQRDLMLPVLIESAQKSQLAIRCLMDGYPKWTWNDVNEFRARFHNHTLNYTSRHTAILSKLQVEHEYIKETGNRSAKDQMRSAIRTAERAGVLGKRYVGVGKAIKTSYRKRIEGKKRRKEYVMDQCKELGVLPSAQLEGEDES